MDIISPYLEPSPVSSVDLSEVINLLTNIKDLLNMNVYFLIFLIGVIVSGFLSVLIMKGFYKI